MRHYLEDSASRKVLAVRAMSDNALYLALSNLRREFDIIVSEVQRRRELEELSTRRTGAPG
jgi:hypothetical protein